MSLPPFLALTDEPRKPETRLYLKQTLAKRIDSPWEWDGGAKDTFYWKIDKPWSGTEVSRVGSIEANHFFDIKTGKTDKATLSNAKRHLAALMKKRGIECTFEYVERTR